MTLSLITRPATSGRAEEILSNCPICGKTGWCYVLPAEGKGSLNKLVCKRNPNEIPHGFEALTRKNGTPVYTNDGELYRVFSKEMELVKEERAKNPQPWVQPERKEKIHDTETWLTAEENNKQYWILANNISLAPHHLGDLARRGFTEDVMKKYGFFSIFKWMKAPRGVSRFFPGFAQSKTGSGIQAANSLPEDGGYAVPYFNYKQEVVGYQIRTSRADRKYIWARGENPSKLKIGAEDPISILHKEKSKLPRTLWAMEGGLKGIGVHERTGLNTLSASGGYFNKGAIQLKEAIEALNIDSIVICPDAGDIVNSHVRLRWTRQAEWLQETFPSVKVNFAWWGQTEKGTHHDIDEATLEELRATKYLSVDQWKEAIRENANSFKELMDLSLTQLRAEQKNEEEERRKGGFGYSYVPQEAAGEDALHWQPGMIIPNGYRDGKSNPTRTIVFKREHKRDLLLALDKNAAKLILVTSVMGSGKSRFTGDFDLEGTPWNKAFYISSSHNEPSNVEIARRYTNIPPRHDGGIKTGSHSIRYNPPTKWYKDAKPEDLIASNCSKTSEYRMFYANGYGADSLEQSPCGTCSHLPYCRAGEGSGYGYFHQKIKALASPYIRCDIRQLPKNTQFKNAIAFVDESDKQLMPTRSTVVEYDKIIGQFEAIRTAEPKLAQDLGFLKDFIAKAFIHTQSEDNYGLPHEVLMSLFVGIPEKKILRRIIAATADILTPKFKDILDLPDAISVKVDYDEVGLTPILAKHNLDHIDWLKYIVSSYYRNDVAQTFTDEQRKDLAKWYMESGSRHSKKLRSERDRARSADNYFLEEVAEKNLAKLNELPGLGLTHLLEFLYTEKGSLRIEGLDYKDRLLYITLPDYRHIEALKNFDTVVLFDATMDIKTTKELFGLKELQVYHIQEELPSYDNLEVISVNIAGVGSSDISEVAKARLNAAVDEIHKRENHKDVAVIGRKGDGDEYYWFHHNRGSNEFYEKRVKTLVAKGTPWVHVGAMRDDCRAIYGDYLLKNPDVLFEDIFHEYYQHKVGAEIQQAAGRLRHQWREDENLKFYILTANLNINFLNKRFGVRVRHMEGFELTPFAGTKSEVLLFKMMGIAHALFDASGKTRLPRQKEIAELLGVKQGRVSQIAEQYFSKGWKEFRRFLLTSLYSPNREINNFGRMDQEGEAELRDWNGSSSESGNVSAFLRQNQPDLAEAWTPDCYDPVLHYCFIEEMVGSHETASTNSLEAWTQWLNELHPYDQGQAIANLFLLSESGSEMRGSDYEGLSGLFKDLGLAEMEHGWYSKWEGLEENMPKLFSAK